MFKWLDKIKEGLVGKYIGSIVRHIIPLLIPYLAALNLDPELVNRFTSDLTVVASALASFLFSLAWSFIQKKKG